MVPIEKQKKMNIIIEKVATCKPLMLTRNNYQAIGAKPKRTIALHVSNKYQYVFIYFSLAILYWLGTD